MACPRFPALARLWRVGLQSRQRSVLAVRQHDRRAGPADDELPRIALEIDGGGPLTGRSGPRLTIVLALERDAVALLLVRSGGRLVFGLRQRRSGGERRKRARQGACENERGDCGFGRHWLLRELTFDALFDARTRYSTI